MPNHAEAFWAYEFAFVLPNSVPHKTVLHNELLENTAQVLG